MRKIKKKETQQKEPMSLRKKIMLFAGIGVLALIIAILIIIENQNGKITLINNTNLELEYLRAYFVNAEDVVGETTYEFERVLPDAKLTLDLNEINLLGQEANLELRFKFAGYDYTYLEDAGYFNDHFKGKATITLNETKDGKVSMKVKASNGFLSSRLILCDEEYIIDYKNGDVDE